LKKFNLKILGESGFDRLDRGTDQEILDFFGKNFGDALQVMPTLLEEWRNNPTSALCTIKCFPWSYKDICVLFGRIFLEFA
jgi:kynurenine 3-monooxygenase